MRILEGQDEWPRPFGVDWVDGSAETNRGVSVIWWVCEKEIEVFGLERERNAMGGSLFMRWPPANPNHL
jgi:hypothetical protein